MKKILCTMLLTAAITGAAFAQNKAHDVARFNTESIDMGKVRQNEPMPAVFTVTNIGKTPLVIEKAVPACGCTAREYTTEPILPGKTGTVKATYNAAAVGKFNKSVTVKFAGIDEPVTLNISGEVEAKVAAAN
jgi:hypothetical protein